MNKYNKEPQVCPKCNSNKIEFDDVDYSIGGIEYKEYHCGDCGFEWIETWKFEKWEEK